MYRTILLSTLTFTLQACGSELEQVSSQSTFLEGGGWKIEESPYNLAPGDTIGICDSENTGISNLIRDAVKIWLKAGGRDDRIKVIEACNADRVIQLTKLTEKVDFYGRAHPLTGNVYNVDVPRQWAGRWTANHEIGHVFGFGHIFNNTVSIMNSDENGKYMNGGELSDYDRAEIKRFLSLRQFAAVNALWRKPATPPVTTLRPSSYATTSIHSSPSAPAPSFSAASVAAAPRPTTPQPSYKSCVGVDGKTSYPHSKVTKYKSGTYTCNNGRWVFSAGR